MSQPTINNAAQPHRGIWIAAMVVSLAVAFVGGSFVWESLWYLSKWSPWGHTIPTEKMVQGIVRSGAGLLFLCILILLAVFKRRFMVLHRSRQVLAIILGPLACALTYRRVPVPMVPVPNVITIGVADNGRLFTDFNHERHHYDFNDRHAFSHSAYQMIIDGSVSAPPDKDTYSVRMDLENFRKYGFALFFENCEPVTVTRDGQNVGITSPRLLPGKYRVVVSGMRR